MLKFESPFSVRFVCQFEFWNEKQSNNTNDSDHDDDDDGDNNNSEIVTT